MIYSATRRRNLLENLINLAGPTAVTIVTLWAVLATPLLAADDDFVHRAIWVLASIVFCIVTHELGHLFVGLLVHRPVRKVLIGRGPTILWFRAGGVRVHVCADVTAGGAVYFSAIDDTSRNAHIAVTAAGPAVNLVTGIAALVLWSAGRPWLGMLAIASLFLAATNAYPSRFASGGRERHTDGMRILRLLRGERLTATFFEGEDLSLDGERVTIRALEEAMDSSSDQVTEAHLLAVLAREPELSAVLANAQINDLVRFPSPPSSVDVRPTRTPTVGQIYKVTFQVGRDLGIARPNAACICLALMAVPSAVATRLNESGVSESLLRELARRSVEPPAEARPGTVLADLPLERWGSAADRVLELGFKIAMLDRSDDTGTQHIVAAMVADRDCRAAQALGSIGFVLHRNDRAAPPGEPPAQPRPLTQEAQSALAAALLRTGPSHPCGTGELCLGIADQSRSMAAALFASTDIDASSLQGAIVSVPREESGAAGFTPRMRQMWELRARARLGAERYADARADYLVLEQHAPSDRHRAITQNNLAWVALMAADPALHAEALERSRAAVAALPDLPSFQGTLAFALLENGSAAEAAEILEETVPKQPRPRDRALELCLLAMSRARLGEGAAAGQRLKEAEDLDPRCALLERARADLAHSPILQ